MPCTTEVWVQPAKTQPTTHVPLDTLSFVLCPLSSPFLAMPPTRGRTRRGRMADDDEATTPSRSALRSAWVEDPPFPPLPSAARDELAAEVLVVDAVAVVPAEGPAEAAAQSRALNQRRATPAEHLFMLRRFDDENPQEQFRLHVMLTCIAAAYPDAVDGDERYKSTMKWFKRLEQKQPGDDSSGGVLSDARKRAAALSRLEAECAHAQQKVQDALVKKLACEERARLAASKTAEAAVKRAAKTAEMHDRRSQEEARLSRAKSSHAAAAAAPQEMPFSCPSSPRRCPLRMAAKRVPRGRAVLRRGVDRAAATRSRRGSRVSCARISR